MPMVTYDEFSAFKSENATQHAETRERLERLNTQVGMLAERVDARMNAFQRTQDLTNRLLVTLIGTMGAAFVATVIATLTR